MSLDSILENAKNDIEKALKVEPDLYKGACNTSKITEYYMERIEETYRKKLLNFILEIKSDVERSK